MGVLLRPRSTFAALANAPRISLGFVAVLGSGLIALLLGLLANQIDHGGNAGALASLLLPVLFIVYWGASALIIDAGAGLAGQAGRWRQYLAVSGFAFIPWVAFGLLSVVEALFGTGSTGESIVAWLTLPLLAWFLVLTTLAVYAVFDVTPYVAVALAMLPDAVLLLLLIALLVATNI
ncbi:MAG TPA: YIP1 family protein [Candidatus Acidoferrales bacterium]|nr:YIP1 family protein [Candidatus Acidoferrales bacterium]